MGRHFIDNDRTKFIGTAGVGYKILETRDTYDLTGPVRRAAGSPASAKPMPCSAARWTSPTLSRGTTKLLDKFLVESGADNTFVQNDIGIQVQMTDVIALAAAYSVRYNTDPPFGFGKTDTLTTLNLVYEIK